MKARRSPVTNFSTRFGVTSIQAEVMLWMAWCAHCGKNWAIIRRASNRYPGWAINCTGDNNEREAVGKLHRKGSMSIANWTGDRDPCGHCRVKEGARGTNNAVFSTHGADGLFASFGLFQNLDNLLGRILVCLHFLSSCWRTLSYQV